MSLKCDNNKEAHKDKNICSISAKNNIGIKEMLTQLSTLINFKTEKLPSDNMFLCNARQVALFKRADAVIRRAIDLLLCNKEMDIVASELKDFVPIVDEMLGKISSNEVLNKIFKGFCVGK